MKTQGKNQINAILGSLAPSASMMCSFRCDRELWNDFSEYCNIKGVEKTTVLIEHIRQLVASEQEKIESSKRLKE